MRVVRPAVILGCALTYLSYVFQVLSGAFLTSGLGDWIDPYFINGLLEHWRYSLLHLADPASPAMYFPVTETLGYSHGLILFAPFYVALRMLFSPFQAYNLTVFLVILLGTLCLYLLFRKFLTLSFIESLILTAFFSTSRNVINVRSGIWSQRLSVYLIPPLLVGLCATVRMTSTCQVMGLAKANAFSGRGSGSTG